MTEQEPRPDRVAVTNTATVTDAFVDWSLNSSNTPEIVALIDGSIKRREWEPITDDPDADFWIEENDHGLFMGWQESLPVSEETGSSWTIPEVEHDTLGTVDRWHSLDHVVKSRQNDRESESALSVKFAKSVRGTITSIPMRVGVAHRIVDRYLNGPLGTETVPYWYWKREARGSRLSWNRGPTPKDRFDDYLHAEVALVADGIYTWRPKRVADVTDDDRVFTPDDG